MKDLLSSLIKGRTEQDSTAPVTGENEPRQLLSRLKNVHFHSIRTRGLTVSTGLVLLMVIIAVSAYSLSLRAYYYSAARASLQAGDLPGSGGAGG